MKRIFIFMIGAVIAMYSMTGCNGTQSSNATSYETPIQMPTHIPALSLNASAENEIQTEPLEVSAVDAVTSASEKESADPTALIFGLSENGYWIFSLLSDVTLTETLVVRGTFHDKDDPEAKIYRKLAPYAQDENHNVTAEYNLTVPLIEIYSPNFRIQNGTVTGDIYVYAEGFELRDTKLTGSLFFDSQELMDTATFDRDKITGQVYNEITDAVTSASEKESADPAALIHGMSDSGYWIFSLLDDITLSEPLIVKGIFYNNDDKDGNVYRKLAPYAQDENRNVTAQYTLTVPYLGVYSPNFRIQNGFINGDIYVYAEGFELRDATVDGNIVFASQLLMDSALLDRGTVTGDVSVK